MPLSVSCANVINTNHITGMYMSKRSETVADVSGLVFVQHKA